MNTKEHNDFIKDIKNYSDELLKSEADVKQFFKDAGIHTQSGRLTKPYSFSEKPTIGYKQTSPSSKK